MIPRVTVRRISGKRLEATARQHRVATDRPADEGGTDTGCTSGELLLMAMGSCATGSLRNFLESRGEAVEGLRSELFLEPTGAAGARDRIVMALTVPAATRASDAEIAGAATGGGVVSRVQLGSEVEVRITRAAT